MRLKNNRLNTLVLLILLTLMACKKEVKIIKKEITKEITKELSKKYPIVTIKPNQRIKSPLKIEVNSNGVWYAFEGELGYIKIYNEAGKEIGDIGILHTDPTKNIDWMADGPIPFETILTFDAKGSKKGKLVITKNASRARDVDSFEIPVRF